MDWLAQPLLENIRERSGSQRHFRAIGEFTNARDDRILFAT
jgi:hypothetical protein